jgi:hypothetical protein
MARSKLLREAIADAKAVRNIALANAKLALEEAFTPHLTSMLATKLRNEDDDYDDEEYDDEMEELNNPVKGDAYGSEDGGETDIDAVEKSSFTEAAVDVDTGVQSDAEKLKSSEIAPDEDNEYGSMSAPEPALAARSSSHIDNEDKLGMSEAFGDDEEIEDFDDEEELEMGEADMEMDMGDEEEEEGEPEDLDLEAIIRELEADIDGEEGEDEFELEPELGEADDELDLDIEDDEEEFDLGEAELPSAADGHGSDEGGEVDQTAITRKKFTTDVGTGPIAEADDFEDDDEEELDLEGILREIEDEEDEEEVEVENAALKAELKEYQVAVKFLRSKLHEVNLLNAKLLFTNKLFRDYTMDVRNKMRVVETFDRATTIREAKLVYATLAESFRSGGKSKRKRTITEGLASKTTGSTRPASKKQGPADKRYQPTILAEGNALADRLKKLAGINN